MKMEACTNINFWPISLADIHMKMEARVQWKQQEESKAKNIPAKKKKMKV